MSDESRIMAGILLLALVTVETGGLYLLALVRGSAPATDFQQSFARAGHAHAGVLLVLALTCQVFADAADQGGVLAWLCPRGGPVPRLPSPTGFFIWSMGRARHGPNAWTNLVSAGPAS